MLRIRPNPQWPWPERRPVLQSASVAGTPTSLKTIEGFAQKEADRGADLRLGFAPPILKDREAGIELSQTALICAYLAENHGLVPPESRLRWHARMVATTLMDAVSEVHDTHHPISVALTYEDQSNEAKKAAEIFRSQRLPEWLQYFERLSKRNGGHLVGSELTYVDLMLHQLLQGLRFAFPEAMTRQKIPRLRKLDDEVAGLEPLQRYWTSERSLPFNQDGIFRRYPELDG